MKKVRITVMKMGCYPDLMAEYENPMDEKSALGHDLLQRRLPAREFFIGNARRLTALLY